MNGVDLARGATAETFRSFMDPIAMHIGTLSPSYIGPTGGRFYVTKDFTALTPAGTALVTLLEELMLEAIVEGYEFLDVGPVEANGREAVNEALNHLEAGRMIARGLRLPGAGPNGVDGGLLALYRGLDAACRAAGVEAT